MSAPLSDKDRENVVVIGRMMDFMMKGIAAKVNKRIEAELAPIYARLEELEEIVVAVKKKLKKVRQQRVTAKIEQDVLTKFKGARVKGKKDSDIITLIRTDIDTYMRNNGYNKDLLPYYLDVDTDGASIKDVRLMVMSTRKRSG